MMIINQTILYLIPEKQIIFNDKFHDKINIYLLIILLNKSMIINKKYLLIFIFRFYMIVLKQEEK